MRCESQSDAHEIAVAHIKAYGHKRLSFSFTPEEHRRQISGKSLPDADHEYHQNQKHRHSDTSRVKHYHRLI
jgi:hypothetical protein